MRKWWVVAALVIAVGVAALVWRSRASPNAAPALSATASTLRGGFERIEVRADPGEEGHTLEGRVLDTSGAPERATALVLRSKAALTGTYYGAAARPQGGVALMMGSSARPEPEVVVTGTDGSYRFETSPGAVWLSASPGVSMERTRVVQVVQLVEGGTQRSLGRAPGTSQLTVNAPVRSGWVLAVVKGDFRPRTPLEQSLMETPWAQIVRPAEFGVADSDSKLAFQGLAPGRYTVVLGRKDAGSARDVVTRRIDVRGDQTLTIEASEEAAE